MVRKVAIVGAGISASNYSRTADEIWGIAYAGFHLWAAKEPVKRLYWIDDLYEQTLSYDFETFRRLTDEWELPGVKLVTSTNKYPAMNTHIQEFDIAQVVKLFGTDWVNNSTAAAIIDAIILGVDELHFHGTDFTPDPETPDRSHHMACCTFWVGVAHMRGIAIKVNPASRFMDQLHYTARGFKYKGSHIDKVKDLPTTDRKKFDEWQSGCAEAKFRAIGGREYEPTIFVPEILPVDGGAGVAIFDSPRIILPTLSDPLTVPDGSDQYKGADQTAGGEAREGE